jgi:glycogen phosphorylase/synthase
MKKPNKLFEVSFEVANKVGGIHTVLSSKAKLMKKLCSKYYCIGPYFEHSSNEFEHLDVPLEFVSVFEELRNLGVVCHFGFWKIESKPECILIDFNSLYNRINEFKFYFWEKFKIDSMHSFHDFNEPLIFSVAVSYLIEFLEKKGLVSSEDVIHCHEWMTGFSFLRLKSINSKIKSVFTTHATVLGRSLAGNNHEVYEGLRNINSDFKAKELGVFAKHSAEKAMALNCDVFTTVSEVTSLESEILLERKPDVLVLNGILSSKFSDEVKKISKSKVNLVVESLIYPDKVSNPLIYYFGGRYEFRAKGLDVYLDALKMLNEDLIKRDGKDVVAIFFLATYNEGLSEEVLRKYNYYSALKFRLNNFKDVYLEDNGVNVLFNKLKKSNKQLVSHKFGGENDALLEGIKKRGLDFSKKVKVIVYPAYLNGGDGLLNLTYYETISGCDLGVFPSYYEPWGYTPLESLNYGVPCVTSTYAGFGKFVYNENKKGVFVLNESDKEEFTVNLFKVLSDFSKFSQKKRLEQSNLSLKVAKKADWNVLIKNYSNAYTLAINGNL